MAISFNGTTSRINAATIPGATGNINKSFAFWWNPTVVNARMFPCMIGNSTNNQRLGLDCFGTSNGKIQGYWGGVTALSTATISASTWSHIAVVYTAVSSTVQLFINGVADVSSAPGISFGNTVFSIGCLDTFLQFNGLICEFAVWDVNLVAVDIASLAAGFTPLEVQPNYRVFYTRMIDSSYFIDQHGLALTSVSLSTADHPRIFA